MPLEGELDQAIEQVRVRQPLRLDQLLGKWEVTRERVGWFVALTCFKYAVILGFNWELSRPGKRPDDIYDELQETTRGLTTDGEAILTGGLDQVMA